MKVDPLQKLRCHGGCCPFVEKHSVALDLLAYENILRNREIAQKVKLLVIPSALASSTELILVSRPLKTILPASA